MAYTPSLMFTYKAVASFMGLWEKPIVSFLWNRKPQSVHSGKSTMTEHFPSTASAGGNREKSLFCISS